jgi:hypothetical protein
MTNQLSTPSWIADLDEAPESLREEVAAHDGFFGPAFYANFCSPSGAELDEFRQRPEFKMVDHYRGFVECDGCIGRVEFAIGECASQDLRYLMVGLIGGPNILSVSGGVVKPAFDGIDLPMPSGRYLVRVEYQRGSDLFRVSRVHRIPDRTAQRLRGYGDDEQMDSTGKVDRPFKKAVGVKNAAECNPLLDTENAQSVQDASYIHEFTKVLAQVQSLAGFDSERIAQLADPDLIEMINSARNSITSFAAAIAEHTKIRRIK